MSGHNVDPAKYRDKNEKFTDKLRGFFEKKSGKKVCCSCATFSPQKG